MRMADRATAAGLARVARRMRTATSKSTETPPTGVSDGERGGGRMSGSVSSPFRTTGMKETAPRRRHHSRSRRGSRPFAHHPHPSVCRRLRGRALCRRALPGDVRIWIGLRALVWPRRPAVVHAAAYAVMTFGTASRPVRWLSARALR